MSTKIYDGKYINLKTLAEFNTFYKSLRETLIPIAQEEYQKVAASLIESVLIWQQTGILHGKFSSLLSVDDMKKDWGISNIIYYVERIAVQEAKSSQNSNTWLDITPELDLKVSMSLFPLEDKTLLIYYITNRALSEAFNSIDTIHEYGYWNNTDRPDDISDTEWEQRRQDWDIALEGIGMPKENGPTIDIIDINDVCYWLTTNKELFEAKLLPYFSDPEELRESLAEYILKDRKYEEFKADSLELTEISRGMRAYDRAVKYVKEHPEELEEIRKTYTDLDIKALVLSMLTREED